VFRHRAHDRLHELAQAVDFSSRAAAGRLLEAKAAMETDLERPASGSCLAATSKVWSPPAARPW
jgi:hypothetical protein